MRFWALILWGMALSALGAEEFQKPVIYTTRPSFYHETPQGTIAFVPGSRRNGDVAQMTTFKAFEDHGHYALPRQKNYGFAINIWDSREKGPSFLAITIIQALALEDSDNATLNLQRSANWEREGQTGSSCGGVDYTLPPDALSLEEFLSWNASSVSIDALEGALATKTRRAIRWHAKPVGGQTTSWEVRDSLFGRLASEGVESCMKRWFSDLPENVRIRASTRLVRFTPSDNRVPRSPMDFYFQFSGASHVAIVVFCPDYSEYSRTAFLTLR